MRHAMQTKIGFDSRGSCSASTKCYDSLMAVLIDGAYSLFLDIICVNQAASSRYDGEH